MKFKLLIISVLGYILAIACAMSPKVEFPYNCRCNYVINGTIYGIDSVLLENISVKMYKVTSDLPPKIILCDSCISNKNGFYEVRNNNAIPYVSGTYELHLSDLNKYYQDSTIVIVFNNENFNTDKKEGFIGEAVWNLDISLIKN